MIMAPKVRSMKIKNKIRSESRLTSGSGTSSVVVEPPTMESRITGPLLKGAGEDCLGSEIEPSPLKEDFAPVEQGRNASPGSVILEGYKQIVEYLRTVAKVIEWICDKNDLLGDSPQRWRTDSSKPQGSSSGRLSQ